MVTEKIIYRDEHSDVNAAAFSYLKEVAFGFEYGGSVSEVIRKWSDDIYVKLHAVNNDGSTTTPNAVDFAELSSVIDELNDLIDTINITLLTGGGSDECVSETHAAYGTGSCYKVGHPTPNVNFYVTTASRFETIDPLYESGNDGFFILNYSDVSQKMTAGRCFCNSASSDTVRKSIIREEMAQVLGLGKDSETHDTSIFYETDSDPGHATSFSEIDKAIIKMLYDPRLKYGMTKEQAEKALSKPSAFIAGRNWNFGGIKTNESGEAATKLDSRFDSSNFRG